MATSAVGICNMSLSHLGQDTQISSISPVDGSRESGYCATFYPIARQEMIESFAWSFATKRVALAQVTNDSQVWTYAYAKPADCLKASRIITLGQFVNIFLRADSYPPSIDSLFDEAGSADFELEGSTIRTHEPEAVLIYRRDVTDTGVFTPGFTSSLSMLLTSYLAGPIIRGAEGARASAQWRANAMTAGRNAAQFDSNASSTGNNITPTHLAARQ